MINGKGELTMRRVKRMVALIMTVMCIFTLTGCATDAEKLVGTWKGEISVNDVMDNTNVASGNLDILLLKQFIDFSEMYIAFDMTFNEDGTYYAKVDEASVQKFLDAVLVEIEKNLYDIVEAEIGKTGVNISVEDMLAYLGVDSGNLIEYIKEMYSESDLALSIAEENLIEGKYDAEDSKLYLSEALDSEVDRNEYEIYKLKGNTLTLLENVGNENGEKELIHVYPFVLTKVE